jgi:hypothetical protein
MSRPTPAPAVRARVPADVEREDQIMFGFSARQLVILGSAGLLLWVLWAATSWFVPGPVFLALMALVGGAAFILAVGRREHMPLYAWLWAAARSRRQPNRLVPVLGSIDAPPDWVGATGDTTPPAALDLPAKGVTEAGLVDLGDDGAAALVGCTTVNVHLRSTDEQHALVGAYGRWLNSLDAPVQIVVASRRVDLTVLADRIAADAACLAHPALERAARAHAAFLERLSTERELLHRTVTVVVRDQRGPEHTVHRAREAARALSACEITAGVFDADATTAALAAAVNPDGIAPPAGLAPPGAVIGTHNPIDTEEY